MHEIVRYRLSELFEPNHFAGLMCCTVISLKSLISCVAQSHRLRASYNSQVRAMGFGRCSADIKKGGSDNFYTSMRPACVMN